MKKFYILCLFPLLFATTCEDDLNSGFETSYFIGNSSSIDLLYLSEGGNFIEISPGSKPLIGSILNSETIEVLPSEAMLFNAIKLYVPENGNFIQVYLQDPIDNDTWDLSEPVTNRFEYSLVITDDDLN